MVLVFGFSFFRVPLKMYFLIAFLTVSTMGLSNASLGYLNYPTQVIFKCCKLIPVLIGGIIIQGIVKKSINNVNSGCVLGDSLYEVLFLLEFG